MLTVQRLNGGWSIAAVATAFGICPKTVRNWRDRRAREGAVGLTSRAVAWFGRHGAKVEKAMTDKGSACKSHAFRDLLGSRPPTWFNSALGARGA